MKSLAISKYFKGGPFLLRPSEPMLTEPKRPLPAVFVSPAQAIRAAVDVAGLAAPGDGPAPPTDAEEPHVVARHLDRRWRQQVGQRARAEREAAFDG